MVILAKEQKIWTILMELGYLVNWKTLQVDAI